MKTFRLIATLVVAAMLLTGCDFFRSLVGKPTSKELEKIKQEAVEQARKQRALDSINEAKALQLEQEKAAAEKAGMLDESAGRYHVILGSFKVDGNAEKMYALLEKNGYTPKVIKFNNGFDVVSVAAYNNYRDALKAMEDIMEYPFCPEDVWIYDINQKMHVKQ